MDKLTYATFTCSSIFEKVSKQHRTKQNENTSSIATPNIEKVYLS